ncbi:MAG: diaminopimelate epimerase [Vicinamibacteraceae bacterium]
MADSIEILKAHAYGNDFLYASAEAVASQGLDVAAFARATCARHTGVGADGLILYTPDARGATMRLLNADGSPSEVSGNGLRGLGAILAEDRQLPVGDTLHVRTGAGMKTLTLVSRDDVTARLVFRADMGPAEDVARTHIDAAGERFDAVTLRVGNPQCVILGPLDEARLHRIGPALQHHPAFPDAVNVELAHVEAPDRVRILIWERGVGPTESSGTGSCASAVAAAFAGGAGRDVEVIAPGGSQRVEWDAQNTVWLTGWAEVVLRGRWLRPPPA